MGSRNLLAILISMKITIIFLTILSLVCPVWAQEENPFKNLDYPELQVAPRASERLAQMAQLEEEQKFINQWPMLVSGAMTLMAGVQNQGKYKDTNPSDSQKRDSDMAYNTALGVGSAWVIIGSYLSFKKPISSDLGDIKKISSKDRRGDLSKERAAEELLERTARTQSTLSNLAVWTNLGASIYVTSKADENNRVYGILAATASLLPWVFPSMYEFNYNKHLEYKRKIYAPLVWMNFDPHQAGPQVNLSWSF